MFVGVLTVQDRRVVIVPQAVGLQMNRQSGLVGQAHVQHGLDLELLLVQLLSLFDKNDNSILALHDARIVSHGYVHLLCNGFDYVRI
jgi:hypothetical protein